MKLSTPVMVEAIPSVKWITFYFLIQPLVFFGIFKCLFLVKQKVITTNATSLEMMSGGFMFLPLVTDLVWDDFRLTPTGGQIRTSQNHVQSLQTSRQIKRGKWWWWRELQEMQEISDWQQRQTFLVSANTTPYNDLDFLPNFQERIDRLKRTLQGLPWWSSD